MTGLLDRNNLERSKTELQNALYLLAPQAWDEGREPGSLSIVFLTQQERVVVRQTPEVHRLIETLLSDLKASAPRTLEGVPGSQIDKY